MTRPATTPAAERMYAAMGALSAGDETYNWPLLRYCTANTNALADVESFSADTDAGDGWTPLLDPTRCPVRALPWLGQMVGATIPPGATDDQARAIVRHSPGWARGTPATVIAAARLWLAAPQLVTLTERVGGDAYAVNVTVYSAQVIDLVQLTAAVKAAMPAGLTLTITVLTGWTYAQANTRYVASTYAAVNAIWAGRTDSDFDQELPP